MITVCHWVRQQCWPVLEGGTRFLSQCLYEGACRVCISTCISTFPPHCPYCSQRYAPCSDEQFSRESPAAVFPDLLPFLAPPLCACGNLSWLLPLSELIFLPCKMGWNMHTHLKGLLWRVNEPLYTTVDGPCLLHVGLLEMFTPLVRLRAFCLITYIYKSLSDRTTS